MTKELQTVTRAIALIRCFRTNQGEIGLAELTRMMRLNKVTVFRLAATLEAAGILKQDPTTHRYCLSYGILDLASPLLTQGSFQTLVLPYMEELQAETGETVSLQARVGAQRVVIQVVSSHQPVRYVHAIGTTAPLHAGAAGRAIMAYLPNEDLERLLSDTQLNAVTQNTVTDPVRVRAMLSDVRRLGYAVSLSERLEGAAAVAAPVFGRNGKVEFALSVLMPLSRATPERVQLCAEKSVKTAEVCSLQLKLSVLDKSAVRSR